VVVVGREGEGLSPNNSSLPVLSYTLTRPSLTPSQPELHAVLPVLI
jgi:hypothetical protein